MTENENELKVLISLFQKLEHKKLLPVEMFNFMLKTDKYVFKFTKFLQLNPRPTATNMPLKSNTDPV